MRDVFGTRLELRLGDPMDSEIDRKVAPAGAAGAAGTRPGARQAALPRALPRIDGDPTAGTLGDGVEDLVTRVARGVARARRAQAAAAARAGRARRPVLAQAGRRGDRARTAACSSASTRRSSRRWASTPSASRTCSPSATAVGQERRCCARTLSEVMRTRTPDAGADRRWSTTGARCWARCPRSTCSTT